MTETSYNELVREREEIKETLKKGVLPNSQNYFTQRLELIRKTLKDAHRIKYKTGRNP
jgi:hypothetical protein